METSATTGCKARLFTSDERMSSQVGDRTFACVEYPGIVENVEKALQTLGGMKSVSKVGVHYTTATVSDTGYTGVLQDLPKR